MINMTKICFLSIIEGIRRQAFKLSTILYVTTVNPTHRQISYRSLWCCTGLYTK